MEEQDNEEEEIQRQKHEAEMLAIRDKIQTNLKSLTEICNKQEETQKNEVERLEKAAAEATDPLTPTP